MAIVGGLRLATLVLLTTTLGGCAARSRDAPGLGEIMSFTQMRHIKLWYAGQAENWPLARYELDELQEGFDEVARLQPNDEGVAVAALLRELTAQPVQQLSAAIASQDRVEFDTAFDSLTAACNACHQASGHGFNVVRRPTSNPYSDQVFAPPDR